MSGSEEGSWRTISWRDASRVKRNDQQLRFDRLDRSGAGQRRIFGLQRDQTHGVDVENALLVVMLSAVLFVINRRNVVIMVMRIGVSVVG